MSLFHQIDELTFSLLPQLEHYEGRVRFGKHGENGDLPPVEEPPKIAAAS